MKKMVFLNVISLIISLDTFSQAKEETTDNFFVRNCRKVDKPCLSMELDTLNKAIIVDQRPVGSETEFTLKIFGKLDKKGEEEHIVKLMGKDNSKCTAFGQGTVAILGFSSVGNPLILTDKGVLEVTSKFVTVGANNLQIVNTKTLDREAFLSRSKDTGRYAISRIHFNSNGDVFFIDGTECFELRKNLPLRKVDMKRCESKKTEVTEISKFDRIRLKSTQKAFEIKDSPYILIVDQHSCI